MMLARTWSEKVMAFEAGAFGLAKQSGVRRIVGEPGWTVDRHDIIVIGGSAGALDPLREIVTELSSGLAAKLFVVLHRPAHSGDMLRNLLSWTSKLPVRLPCDGEGLESGTIYIAPPDQHLILKKDYLRLTRGPRENQWRPAIDVLFRSAAVVYGSRVIGVILSGALDDGSAGLSAVKRCGGMAIVQAPADAAVSDMPESAIRNASVDHIVPARQLPEIIQQLAGQPAAVSRDIPAELLLEAQIAEAGRTSVDLQNSHGELTPFTCADCGGPLWEQRGEGLRFRCLTGHALSARSLERGLDQNLEAAIWAAIRQFEQRTNLQRAMAEEEERKGRSLTASNYRDRASEARSHADALRQLLLATGESSTAPSAGTPEQPPKILPETNTRRADRP
jgi:two-component system chemotaxis response regulator CheB